MNGLNSPGGISGRAASVAQRARGSAWMHLWPIGPPSGWALLVLRRPSASARRQHACKQGLVRGNRVSLQPRAIQTVFAFPVQRTTKCYPSPWSAWSTLGSLDGSGRRASRVPVLTSRQPSRTEGMQQAGPGSFRSASSPDLCAGRMRRSRAFHSRRLGTRVCLS